MLGLTSILLSIGGATKAVNQKTNQAAGGVNQATNKATGAVSQGTDAATGELFPAQKLRKSKARGSTHVCAND